MLTLDGSHGEGGGQILRSALALAATTGQAFRIERIRSARKRGGLRRQHLTAVRAARTICDARVDGETIGSTELSFQPDVVAGGDYRYRIRYHVLPAQAARSKSKLPPPDMGALTCLHVSLSVSRKSWTVRPLRRFGP